MDQSNLIKPTRATKLSQLPRKFPSWSQLLSDITEEILRVFQYSDEGMSLTATQHSLIELFWDEYLLHHEKHPSASRPSEIIEMLEDYVLPLYVDSNLEFRELTTGLIAFLSFADRILKWEYARATRMSLRDWEMDVGDFFKELLENSNNFSVERLAS